MCFSCTPFVNVILIFSFMFWTNLRADIHSFECFEEREINGEILSEIFWTTKNCKNQFSALLQLSCKRYVGFLWESSKINIFDLYFQANGGRYYYEGLIKLSKDRIDVLKGMNANFLTNSKEFDYRFIVRVLKAIFDKNELTNGCVRDKNQTQHRPSQYQQLDTLKFDFAKGMYSIIFNCLRDME